ncbi:MAG TPA: DUF523 and DUF1722 domain-containing protein [Actinomycetota bacterium]|nr:DUF523 and DUF1722 domain-containing protein [Actinomycetota bacterium]
MDETALRLGISSCLLGERVRHDGGHKRDRFLTEVLGKLVEWVPVCPEVEIGMGTPREPVRLESDGDHIKMLGIETRTDWTDQMDDFSRTKARFLEGHNLSGYIFKSRSPSCGLDVAIEASGHRGQGKFSSAISLSLPLLPVEEETRLDEPAIRESFIERIFAYRRLEDFFAKRRTVGQVVMFNSQHRLQLQTHSVSGQKELSQLVSEGTMLGWAHLRSRYRIAFMRILHMPATSRRHHSVLRHTRGHLESTLSFEDMQEIEESLAAYAEGAVPLLVPLTLLRHHVRTTKSPSLKGQTYLEPHPHELLLRNHV